MSLQEVIETGKSLVRNDVRHDLPLYLRRRLLRSLDATTEFSLRHIGHWRRVRLATLAIEKVLPLWQSHFQDRTPDIALELAGGVLSRTIESTLAESECDNLWSHCDELLFQFEGSPNILTVAYGAIQIVRGALSDTFWGCDKTENQITDIEIEPYEHDPSFLAAVAYSNGAPWDGDSDPLKRLEFWEWWLDVAREVSVLIP